MSQLFFTSWLSVAVLLATICVFDQAVHAQGANLTPDLLKYTGNPREADITRDDGGLAPAVGVTNIQIVRANRTHPDQSDGTNYTYKHAPNIVWWQGHFYVSYVNGPRSEHEPPCVTMLTRSPDGQTWEKPRPLFDVWQQGASQTVAHQRMAFFVTRDGSTLLGLGFQGLMPAPNNGAGVGRLVREIKADGSLGPAYFLRYNPGYNEQNTPHPLFTRSDDAKFIAACEELLANKLVMQQCQEEDSRATDDFYALSPKVSVTKAFCFWTLPDGRTAGVWKGRNFTVAGKWEHGQIPPARVADTLPEVGSKYWVQRTSDGQYALVCNPTGGKWSYRFPLAVSIASDGLTFETPYVTVHGERNRPRFWGNFKDPGPQYVRGIEEGYPAPPDGAMWLSYSVNKEDMWVSRVPVPVTAQADDGELIDEDFSKLATGAIVPKWNIYSPVWARVGVVEVGGRKVLRLSDRDRYDYAKAVRIFPASPRVKVEIDLDIQQAGEDGLWIELLNRAGKRPVRVGLARGLKEFVIRVGSQEGRVAVANLPREVKIELSFDAAGKKFDCRVNGQTVAVGLPGVEEVANVERLELRTGAYRNESNDRTHLYANPNKPSDDLPAADEPAAETIVDVRRVVIRTEPAGVAANADVEVESARGVPGRSYALGTARPGARVYLDRDYTVQAIPSDLDGVTLVATSNEDDGVPADQSLLKLRLHKPGTVYVAYGTDAERLPGWLSDWTRHAGAVQIEQRTVASDFQVFSKRVQPGEITLNGNGRAETGAKSNYFILVKFD